LADVEAPVAAQFLRSSGIELSFLSQVCFSLFIRVFKIIYLKEEYQAVNYDYSKESSPILHYNGLKSIKTHF
jgi:hypothetical protein